MSSHPLHTSFTTSITSLPTSTHSSVQKVSSVVVKATSSVVSTVQASRPKSTDGFGPTAIIGIVAGMTFLLLCVPIIALLLRRYERKRCHEIPAEQRSCKSSIRDESLRRIVVTKELQRESLVMSVWPEAHMKEERIRCDAKGVIPR